MHARGQLALFQPTRDIPPRGWALGLASHLPPEVSVRRAARVSRGSDLRVALPITLYEAVLGGKVRVPTIGGPVMLNVPAGSNTGTSLRLKGRGLLDRKSGQRGDQYVRLKVMLPEVPDEKLKAFLESWEGGKAYDPRKAMEQFT